MATVQDPDADEQQEHTDSIISALSSRPEQEYPEHDIEVWSFRLSRTESLNF